MLERKQTQECSKCIYVYPRTNILFFYSIPGIVKSVIRSNNSSEFIRDNCQKEPDLTLLLCVYVVSVVCDVIFIII